MSTREFEGFVCCDRCGCAVTEGIGAILGDRTIVLCVEHKADHADALHKQGWTVVTIRAVGQPEAGSQATPGAV